MKKQLTKICMPIVIMLITATVLGLFPVTSATELTAQTQAETFIETALPVDSSKYNVTLKNHSTYGTTDTLKFTLDSNESTLLVVCDLEQNVVRYCHVYTEKGQVISDKQHNNLIDAVKSFLEKYEDYTKIDSTTLINMLDKADLTKDTTVIEKDIELTVSNFNDFGTEKKLFKWAYVINGAEYNSLQVGFQKNGLFDALVDTRAIYSIGDTNVNISRDQAIDIAMKYSKTYSYAMPGGSRVTSFNITEDRTKTELLTTTLNSTELRPYWIVKLYLNQTYPGSVKGLSMFIWANSGEVFDCSNIASGGVDNSYLDNTSNASSSTNSTTIIIVTAAIIVGIASTVAFIKKRCK